MGINGLLPALKPIAKAVHISKYKGQRAAVDGYSWLHKGAYCCAKELCEGSWTDKYVTYFLSRIQLLRSAGIEPLVVFDGGRLPIKGEEEHSRHRARAGARDKAAAHLAAGNVAAAVECYQRCVDITPAMAKHVIEELKVHGVQFVVAPYEADAQMAYLARKGDVQLIVTEDSDLLAYGCPRVLYKLDRSGSGEELSLSDLPNCPGLPLANFTSDQFLQLCVMAGCDFLAQLPGIGLKKAHGVLRKYRSFTKVVKMLRFNGTRVPPDYEVRFQLALWAFRHCRVYCPIAKALVHLAPLPAGGLGAADVDVPEALTHLEQQQQQQRLDFLGPDLPEDVARGIAEGALDPMTHKPYDLAAIFAGCRNPPPHIAALLPSAAPEPHPLGLGPAGRGLSSGPVSGGARGPASGVAAAAAGSRSGGPASRPKVGMSKRHVSAGQHRIFGAAVSGRSSGAAAAGSGGGGGTKKRSTLGIAKYFTATAAADAAELQTADAAVPNGAASQHAAAAGDAAAAAPKQNMQHSIMQALQALRQQQQQRQEQERAKQQQAMQQQTAATPEDWATAAGISETAGPGAASPAGKRRRLSNGATAKLVISDSGMAGCFTPAGAGDNNYASPNPTAALSLSTENDAGSLPDQRAGSATAAAGGCRPVVDRLDLLEHDGSGQLMQQLQRQSQKQLKQPVDVLSVDLVIPDSQEHAEDSGVGAAAAAAAMECLVGQGSHSMFSNALPAAEVAPPIELMQHTHAQAHAHGLACSLQAPVLSTDSLPNCSGDVPGSSSIGDLQQQQQQQRQARCVLGHQDPFAEPGLDVESISQGDAPQESLGISTDLQQQWQQQQQASGNLLGCQPTQRHQQQQHSLWQQAHPTQGSGSSFGISSTSGQPSSQEQQCSDPFGVQGTAAAMRGAAVSALTALIIGISAEQQQQQERQQKASQVAAAAGKIMRAKSRGSSRFFPGSSSSPVGSLGAADLMIDNVGSLSSSDGIPGSGSSDPIGLSGRSFAGSDSDELGQQARCNPWARSSLPCQPQQQLHSQTGLAGAVTAECGVSDGEQVVAPPRAHHLALNPSSSQAWRQLKHSLRSKGGEQQQQRVNQGRSLRSLLGRHRGIGRGFQPECIDAAVPTTADLPLDGSDPDSILGVGLDQLSPTGAMGRQPGQLRQNCNTELLPGLHQEAELLQGQHDKPRHEQRCQPLQQQQLRKSHAAPSVDLAAEQLVEQHGVAAAAAQAVGSGSSSGGSSSNDENAEPADPGNIHSIAHIKQYAKLATKVVKKVQKQQQQQQVSPLMGVGSTANTIAVAAGGASQTAADTLVGARSFLRSSGKHSNAKQRLQQQRPRQQQRRKSTIADLDSFRCDPYKLFVPVQPLSSGDEQSTGAGAAGLQHAQKRRQCIDFDPDLDTSLNLGQGRVAATGGCELLNSASDGLGSIHSLGEGDSQLRGADEEDRGLLGDHASANRKVYGIDAGKGAGIAAKPFKAPWQKSSRQAAGGLDADEVDVQLADEEQSLPAVPGSGFGAFGRFTCGASGLRMSAGGSRAGLRPGSRLR